jgi:ATP-dependent helicase/nuclease subunit B
MFDHSKGPRLFSVPLGVDFPRAVIEGLRDRLKGSPPEAIGRVQIIVNTSRMKRRLMTLFADGNAGLIPRITLLGELGQSPAFRDFPKAAAPLERRMDLISLVASLIDAQPDLAPRSSLFDLAESLAGLFDEMQGEGVSMEDITGLDVANSSGHWERAKSFIEIAGKFLDARVDALDPEARQRAVIGKMLADWKVDPPQHPILLAGSTGSRGTTAILMRAIARLPQGAVLLPGFDRDMPKSIWDGLADDSARQFSQEDHPQYRFAKLLADLEVPLSDVDDWSDAAAVDLARNKVVSLALRPVPVTDSWLTEGPELGDLQDAMAGVTLVEAPTPRMEALAIAMRLRQAAQDGETAALITPDRMLSRQVSAALARWNIVADDSAGLPLQLSPPGRFLRHVADLFTQALTAESLLTVLKHPLTHSEVDRGPHLLFTRELELRLRRYGPAFPDEAALMAWAEKQTLPGAADWAAWVARVLCDQEQPGAHEAGDLMQLLMDRAAAFAAGPSGVGSGELWLQNAGREALKVCARFREAVQVIPEVNARDFADLFGGVLSRGEVRNPDAPHPSVLIWGTLEARVQGADLLILAGLNEGSWPEAPSPDPWLNRQMRAQAGLLLPERRIGLSAHDFQQAIAAPKVWVTRAVQSDDAQTVPSRWLNRLLNLMDGLKDQRGPDAIAAMTARGADWLARAQALEAPIDAVPAPRPSPRPPAEARPRQLSVTEIKTLVRNPYAVYAKHVLGLKPLDPLTKTPDARLRGIASHQVFEDFVKGWDAANSVDDLVACARTIFEADVDWPSARLLWEARLSRTAPEFVRDEAKRQADAVSHHYEIKGASDIPELGFRLVGQADRIDMDARGGALLYDYKTGAIPTKDQQKRFDMQLLLEAAMVLRGSFEGISPRHIERAQYLGVGSKIATVDAPLEEMTPTRVWLELTELVGSYLDANKGFTARRAMEKASDEDAYDQLARYEEWSETTLPDPDGALS